MQRRAAQDTARLESERDLPRVQGHATQPASRLPKRERVALYVPKLPDTVWSVDFMSDALACGRRFRTFNVVDDFNREVLHLEANTSISSHRLVRVFEQIKHDHCVPQVVWSGNRPEFLREAFSNSLKTNGVAI